VTAPIPFPLGYNEHVPDHEEQTRVRDWLYIGSRHLACSADHIDGNAGCARAPVAFAAWLADASLGGLGSSRLTD
jgi:hypothetical protein